MITALSGRRREKRKGERCERVLVMAFVAMHCETVTKIGLSGR